METDLHRIIYSGQTLTIDHAQYFIYQIFRGLKYLHSMDIIHYDLKPSCILVNSNCDLKISEFSCSTRGGVERDYCLWYRAPEVLLGYQEFLTPSVDIWSAGCIFGELLARETLFSGTDYIEQLRLISAKIGRPTESELDVVSERAKRFMLTIPMNNPLSMAELFPLYSQQYGAHAFLKRLLDFHPRTRPTAAEALAHPFLMYLHDPEDEPVSDFTFPDPELEKNNLSRERLQDMIWYEIRDMHPNLPESFRSFPQTDH